MRRARRMHRQGKPRKAAVALRELAARTEEPAHWVALGHALGQARREDEAVVALRQGMWLHQQRGADARARTVARLILDIDPSDRKAERYVAMAAAA